MSIPGGVNPLLLRSAAAAGGYTISRSLRFNSSDSAYLSRNVSSETNRKTFTFAAWVKRSKLGSGDYYLFHGVGGSGGLAGYTLLGFSADQLWFNDGFSGAITSTAKYRDPSAWYHVVFAVDSTQATDSNRVKMYVNGVQLTSFSSAVWPSLNRDFTINAAVQHTIGWYFSASNDFLLADIHFIDGQALTPSSFTTTDANGELQPIAYTGSYGTNGFKLDFADNSTAAALGTDTSGNSNTWTVNNISAISGPGYGDVVTSVPYSGTATAVLDTDLTNFVRVATSNYGTSYWTVTFSKPIPITSSVVCRVQGESGATNMFRIQINGSTDTILAGVAGQVDLTLNLGGATSLSSLDFRSYAGSGYGANLYSIEVNGNVIYTSSVYAGNDSLVDTPTSYGTDTGAGGEVRGNYATWNPSNYSSAFFSDGNLKFNPTSGYNETAKATMAIGDKCYFEVTILSPNTAQDYLAIGLMRQETQVLSGPTAGYNIPVGASGNYTGSVAYFPYSGRVDYNGSSVVTGLSTCTVGDVVSISYDPGNGQVKVYKNGVALNSGNAVYTLSTAYRYAPAMTEAANNAYYVNFGQRPFAYTAPSGFKTLCDTNLPAPTIAKGSTAMDVVTYTGNGSARSITLPGGFSPDLIWTKSRSSSTLFHHLYDSVRGTNSDLSSNSTSGELTGAPYNDGVTAFGSNGYSLGAFNGVNENTTTYAAWCWDAGSSSVTNNAGSISSTVRANTSAGFSIVTYTGNGVNGASIGHGLGVAPHMVISKSRSNSNTSWGVFHKSLGAGKNIWLDLTNAASTGNTWWYGVDPTSTVTYVGSGSNETNQNGWTFVHYCFAPVAGYSAFGSYTGNGSTDGPFVFTGMRTRWVLIKNTGAGGNVWVIYDTARDTYNIAGTELYPNLTSAEAAGTAALDIVSNGFKIRTTSGGLNASGGTYIYAAFAENPFQYARAR